MRQNSKNETIKIIAENFRKMAEVFNRVSDENETVINLVHDLGVTATTFYKNIKLYNTFYKNVTPYINDEIIEDMFTGYEKLYSQIIGVPVYALIDNCPENLNQNFELAFEMFLTERQRNIIKDYYLDGLTLDEIGTNNGVTRERIRQIIEKSKRILKHPKRRTLIETGVYTDNSINEKHEVVYDLDSYIEVLDLSTRAYNSINRYCEKGKTYSYNTRYSTTIRKLAELTPDELAKLRNIGRNTYDEIYNKVWNFIREHDIDIDGIPADSFLYDIAAYLAIKKVI